MKDSDTQEYGRQMVALLRRLAEADGDATVLEKRWLRTLLQELPGHEEAAESGDFDPQRLKALVEEEGEAEELMELLLLVSLADGETSAKEWALIQNMADLVGITPERLEILRETTVLTVEPT